MQDYVELQIRIEGKHWAEYLKMGVKQSRLSNADHIRIEIDVPKAMTLLSSLSQAISNLSAGDSQQRKNPP